jgi:hypothetical protein
VLFAAASLWLCGCSSDTPSGLDGGTDAPLLFVDGPRADLPQGDATKAGDAAWDLPPADAGRDGGGPIDAVTSLDAGADSGPTAPLRIYLSTQGKDINDGLTTATSIKTLGRAQAIIAAAKPQVDVEVRIAPGTYYGDKVSWTTTMPSHTITFMPLAGGKQRPIFDGCLSAKPPNPKTGCPGGTWFKLSHSKGQKTNLHFEYIRVRRYQTAISLNGARNAANTSNSHNRIYGCYFDNIGNNFNTTLAASTAAVRLVNSNDNVIANTHFVSIINASKCGLLHAIYAAHMSDRNQISNNRFASGCGDPVRLRDFSNNNVIKNNTFEKIGVNAAYTDWYCDHEVNTACTKPTPECPSWENQFRDNVLDGDWSCNALGVFKYFQDDKTTGCSPPSLGAKRLYTSGNTKTPVPCSGP